MANSIGVGKREPAAPHRADPVEELHAGRHGDEHTTSPRRTATPTAPVANMWWAHTPDRQRGDGERGEDHALVAEHRAATRTPAAPR